MPRGWVGKETAGCGKRFGLPPIQPQRHTSSSYYAVLTQLRRDGDATAACDFIV